MNTQEQITRLLMTIKQQEQEVFTLEKEIAEVRQEIAPFEARYHQATHTLFQRISAARAAIKDLQDLQRQRLWGVEDVKLEDLWRDAAEAAAAEEQPQEAVDIPEEIELEKRPPPPQDLKQMYRKLARRYHPDLAADDADRLHRTRLMAMINEAYRERDKDALLALMDSDDDTPDDNALPVDVLKLRQLQQKSTDLAMQIEDLKSERFDLIHGEMMDLKIQERLAKAQGQDFLKNLVNHLQSDYQRLMQQLDKLRDSMN